MTFKYIDPRINAITESHNGSKTSQLFATDFFTLNSNV